MKKIGEIFFVGISGVGFLMMIVIIASLIYENFMMPIEINTTINPMISSNIIIFLIALIAVLGIISLFVFYRMKNTFD